MKLLLLQPPIQDFYDTDIRLQPIGLAYLKAAVRHFLPDVEVVIRDYHQGRGRRTVPLPRELAYLRDYYPWPDKSPFCTFHEYFHFGADFETLARDVAAEAPDLVGISSLFSPYYREALAAAAAVKQKLGVPVLMGGSHVSAMPEFMLARPEVDFIIRGEGERPLVEFLKAWQAGAPLDSVPGLGFKREGALVLNPVEDNFAMDDLPVPDLSDFRPEDYLFENRPMSFVITSRSCPHKCTFCSVHKTFGFDYRRRSVPRVLDEIRARYAQGYRVFDFEDDNLTYYREPMKELCRSLIAEFPRKDIQCVAMNGISYLSLDEELLGLMKEAGFTHLNLALVSSDLTVRETTKRPHTIKKYLEIVRLASRMGFEMVSYQILGLPNESLESMIQTLVFNAGQPVLLGASPFYLTPNSPIAKDFPAPSETDVFRARLTAMAVETQDFKRDAIYTLFVTTRILNFLKGLPVPGEVSLEEALAAGEAGDARSQLGVRLFRKILSGEGLFAQTPQGLKPLPRFRSEVFFRVWNRIGRLACQNSGMILMDEVRDQKPEVGEKTAVVPTSAL